MANHNSRMINYELNNVENLQFDKFSSIIPNHELRIEDMRIVWRQDNGRSCDAVSVGNKKKKFKIIQFFNFNLQKLNKKSSTRSKLDG